MKKYEFVMTQPLMIAMFKNERHQSVVNRINAHLPENMSVRYVNEIAPVWWARTNPGEAQRKALMYALDEAASYNNATK